MKIGLINPKTLTTGDPALMNFFNAMSQVSGYIESIRYAISTGLLIIAALTPEEHQVIFIDENNEDIDFNEKYDIVGLSCTTQQATRAYKIADEFRNRGNFVVLGGIHPSVLPNEAKNHCDAVFIGEAEITWPEFLEDFKNEMVKPFYKSEIPPDMEKTPLPRYELLNKDYYKVMWVQTSRGCPHDCSFCGASKVYGFKLRHKHIDKVVEEIKKIRDIWPDIKIDFADDNIFASKKYAKELLHEIKGLKLQWYAQTDISVARDNELLDMIKEAGCLTLFIGFESISEESLKAINSNSWKQRQLPFYEEAIQKIQSKGIGVLGAFIIGFDHDNEKTIDDLIQFIRKNKIFACNITILTPLPGTELFKKFTEENRLLNKEWADYTFMQVVYKPVHFTPENLQKKLMRVYKNIYSPEARLEIMEHFKKIYKNLALKNK